MLKIIPSCKVDHSKPIIYFPAHIKNGQAVTQKASFYVYEEDKYNNNNKQPVESPIIAFGKLADCCCNLSKGKTLAISVIPSLHSGPVFGNKYTFELKQIILVRS